MRAAIFLILLFASSIAQATSYFPPEIEEELKKAVESPRLHQLVVQEVAPAIHKAWKLVSVSAADNPGSFMLWFQADDGSIYVMRANLTQDQLAVHDLVYKIPAK